MEFILLKPMFGIDLPDRLPVTFFLFLCFLCSVPVGKHKNSTHFLKRKGNNFSHVCVYAYTHIHMCVCIYIKKPVCITLCILKIFFLCITWQQSEKVIVKIGGKKHSRKRKYRLGELRHSVQNMMFLLFFYFHDNVYVHKVKYLVNNLLV